VLVLAFLGTLLSFLLVEGVLRQMRQVTALDNRVLDDQILAYHLDWKAIQDPKLLVYLYVKKVNAVVRYQSLAGVSYEEARQAVEYLLANPELLPSVPQKRRPALPEADDEQLLSAVVAGNHDEAVRRYQALVDVDPFTARQVVERLARQHYLTSLEDSDVEQRLEEEDEAELLDLLASRYALSQEEALIVLEAMQARLLQ
jgi:hypothetical protein